ncbi:uncharacterized protein LOC107792646 [Nicotiana tabacum]|uniref:Uncharacterized protein LOC107792646 n=1 Tax=Nicotiana tabacum TaxID=4097 RepID=A0A1S4A190_TOBAC
MVQKRSYGEEELYEVSSKQPRHEPSCQIVSVLELSRESVAVKAYASGGDEENSSRTNADSKPDSHNVAEALFSSEKETEMGIYGSASNSSWPTSCTSEEDIRPEARFHILMSPEYYYFDNPFRAAAHHGEMHSSLLCDPPQKMVPIGPDFQAELPEWVAFGNQDKLYVEGIHETLCPSSQADENKLAGTSIITMPAMELCADHGENIVERGGECPCEDIGSIRCVRLHIMETREKLKLDLGEETFVRLGFCDMGEVVAEKWSEEEEELFHEVVLSNPASLGKNFWNHLAIEFPSRSRKELVSYYFNVFILRKRAEQNRFDPLNIDSDNDEWLEIVGDADQEANMTDEDEESVVESPAYHNDLSGNGIHEELDKHHEDVGDATWEDYKAVNVCSTKVFTDVPESCPGELFDSNSSYKLSLQPQDQGLSNKVVKQEVQDGSCTTVAAGVTSESSLGQTNNGKRWANDITGMGSGIEHDRVLGPCGGKEWDVGYLSCCARNEVDLLPTCTMIEEVFGDGAWIYKS